MSWFESAVGSQQDLGVGETMHFGASWGDIRTAISDFQPDIIGITNLFRENTAETIIVAEIAKQTLPDCLVVVGGPNANAIPAQLLSQCPQIDLVGLGDGEITMRNLVRYRLGSLILDEIPGLMFRDSDGNPKRTGSKVDPQDLDQYGAIDYGLVRLERYFAYESGGIMARNKFVYPGAERAVSMVTSRGCPYNCTFCSIHIHAGKKFRRHSVDYLVAQVENLVNRSGVRHIHFEDDNLTLDKTRFTQFLNETVRRKLRFTWDTPNGVFAEKLDKPLLELMKQTGCTYAIVGVESGDQSVLDNIIRKQPLQLETVVTVFQLAKELGLDLHAFYIIGFPGETKKQIERTLDFAIRALKEYGVIPHLSLARADPGTTLYDEATRTNTLVKDAQISNAAGVRSDMFRRHLIATDEFDPNSLERMNDAFHRECIRIIMSDRLRFLIFNPILFLGVLKFSLRDILFEGMDSNQAIIKLFWCKLLYKNSMKDRVGHGVGSLRNNLFSD